MKASFFTLTEMVIVSAATAAVTVLLLACGRPTAADTVSDIATQTWRKSLTVGADVPMRAEMKMSQRHHGKTYYSTAHIVQGSRGRFRMEYVLPVEARGRIVFSDGKTNWQYEPKRNVVERTDLIVMSELRDRDSMSLIEANYRIELVDSKGSAGARPATVIDLIPKHAGKSRQRRWIDRQTCKTLRIETHYTDGILASMVSYDQTELPAAVADADFQPMRSDKVRSVGPSQIMTSLMTHTIPAKFSDIGLKPTAALGFQLVEISASEIEGAPASQLLYSDGIETVSIFVQSGDSALSAAPQTWKQLRVGNHTVYENVDHHVYALTWLKNGRRYTAISHLTHEALQQLVVDQM